MEPHWATMQLELPDQKGKSSMSFYPETNLGSPDQGLRPESDTRTEVIYGVTNYRWPSGLGGEKSTVMCWRLVCCSVVV